MQIIYSNLKYKILKPFRNAIKIYRWYKNVFKYDYDFGATNLPLFIGYKLTRTLEVMKNDKFGCDKHTVKAMRIAIKLCNRISTEYYEDRLAVRIDKKWGKAIYWTTPKQCGNLFSWHTARPNAVFEKQKKAFKEEQLRSWEIGAKLNERDRRNLFNILNKYLDRFWC